MATQILVVDDDVELRDLLRDYLARQGIEVSVLHDAGSLERRLERERPDLIVLDLMMPGVDGYAVVKRVKEKWPQRLPQIIIMTAVSEALRHDFPEPVCTVLPKPFDIDKLASVVHECARGCSKG